MDTDKAKKYADAIFVALPHGASMTVTPDLLGSDKKVVDLSGDFRLETQEVYEKWYGMKHKNADYLGTAVYGLTELNHDEVKDAEFVTNPGCYPTGALLALAPLLKSKMAENIIIDSKSGVSGAGKGLTEDTHFARMDESVKAYGIATHKHTPEIEQEAGKISEVDVTVSFTPHLIPMNRGILSTCYCDLSKKSDSGEIINLYKDFYGSAPFIKILEEGFYPETKNVMGSNYCHIGIKVDARTGRVIVVSAIDNLVKGASGQAIQNMNLMFGLEETEGLEAPGLTP